MGLPRRRIIRIQHPARMRNSVASASSKVQPVTGTSVMPYNPGMHSTSVVEKRQAGKQGAEKTVRKFDTLEIGGRIVATNDPRKFVERRNGKRLDLKA